METPRVLTPRFVRRSLRRGLRRLGHSEFELVYHEKYNAAFPDVPNDPLRAERIVAFLASEGLVLRSAVHRPEPVWLKALERVHDSDYLDRLHQGETLTSIMGVEIRPQQADRLIDFQRLQTGGTLMATRKARAKGFAVNLGGGFHHADHEGGAGFCMFNDIAVAIADERRRGFTGRVLVIDLDLHDGDGTRRIFADDPSVHTFSIHARHWGESGDVEAATESTAIELGDRVDDATYLGAIKEHLRPVVRRFKPRLVIYLAGCDPAHDDTLGNWSISPEAMLRRDQRVYTLVRQHRRIPMVLLLAGGYSPESWRYTARFLANPRRRGGGLEPPSTEEITLRRYRYISGLFDARELSGGGDNELGLTAEDILPPGWGVAREHRFLDYYTKHGLELVFERSGFYDRLRDLGFAHPTLDLQLDDPAGDTLRIFGDPDRSELLSELRLRRDRRTLAGFELLSIEWLLLQNPRAEFSRLRPALPGQQHPGLGMLADVVALLQVACERLHLDGLVFVPAGFHIAAYGKGLLRFLHADAAARFAALERAFSEIPLARATGALVAGRVVDRSTGEVVRWQPSPMVLPVSRKLAEALRKPVEAPTPDYDFSLRANSSQTSSFESV